MVLEELIDQHVACTCLYNQFVIAELGNDLLSSEQIHSFLLPSSRDVELTGVECFSHQNINLTMCQRLVNDSLRFDVSHELFLGIRFALLPGLVSLLDVEVNLLNLCLFLVDDVFESLGFVGEEIELALLFSKLVFVSFDLFVQLLIFLFDFLDFALDLLGDLCLLHDITLSKINSIFDALDIFFHTVHVHVLLTDFTKLANHLLDLFDALIDDRFKLTDHGL
jgi:hypothetical protein